MSKAIIMKERAMRTLLLAMTATLSATLPMQSAHAWMRGGGGDYARDRPSGENYHNPNGGYTHASNTGGFEHATTVGPNGASHVSDSGGYAHGSAVNSQGAEHTSDYGGYAHTTTEGPNGVSHSNTYSNGNYYHQPAVVNNYNGGGWGAPVGAAVVGGLAVGAVVGASVASSANANANAYAAGAAAATAAYQIGATYGALPHGCAYLSYGGSPYYNCGGAWMAPAYGANGLYYRVVSPP